TPRARRTRPERSPGGPGRATRARPAPARPRTERAPGRSALELADRLGAGGLRDLKAPVGIDARGGEHAGLAPAAAEEVAEQGDQAGALHVGPERPRSLPRDPRQAEERARPVKRVDEPVAHGRQDLLLAGRPRPVVLLRVALVLAHAGEPERGGPIQVVFA